MTNFKLERVKIILIKIRKGITIGILPLLEGIMNPQPLTLEITISTTTLQDLQTILRDGLSSHLKMAQLIRWKNMIRNGIGVKMQKVETSFHWVEHR